MICVFISSRSYNTSGSRVSCLGSEKNDVDWIVGGNVKTIINPFFERGYKIFVTSLYCFLFSANRVTGSA